MSDQDKTTVYEFPADSNPELVGYTSKGLLPIRPRSCATCGFNLNNGTCPTLYWRLDGKEICVSCYNDLFNKVFVCSMGRSDCNLAHSPNDLIAYEAGRAIAHYSPTRGTWWSAKTELEVSK